MDGHGLLLVMMEPPAAMEEEFHAWYDTEHLPDRMTVPGFLYGARYVCLDGYPRYMALYDLTAEDVLDSDAYMAISGAHFTPWTRRVTSRMPVYRAAGTQLLPGDGVTGPVSRLILLRTTARAPADALMQGLTAIFADVPQVTQMRLFACKDAGGPCHLALIGLSAPPVRPVDYALGAPHWSQLTVANTYAPYSPTGTGPGTSGTSK